METELVDKDTAKKILAQALEGYDGSGDWWMGVSDNLDVNVYVEDGQMRVVLYPYSSDYAIDYRYQTLAHVNGDNNNV